MYAMRSGGKIFSLNYK